MNDKKWLLEEKLAFIKNVGDLDDYPYISKLIDHWDTAVSWDVDPNFVDFWGTGVQWEVLTKGSFEGILFTAEPLQFEDEDMTIQEFNSWLEKNDKFIDWLGTEND